MEHDPLEHVAACEKRLSYMATYMAMHDRFNYEIFSRMKKTADPGIATAGVEPDGIRVLFRYNPEYIHKLSTTELAYVVSHNVGHVVMHHFDRQPPPEGKDRVLFDMAADMAINSLFIARSGVHDVPIRREPDLKDPKGNVLIPRGLNDCLMPERLGLPPRLSLEKYLDHLRELFAEDPDDPDDGDEGKEGDGSSSGGGKSGGKSGKGTGDSSNQDNDAGDSDSDNDAGDSEKSGKPSTSHSGWKKDTLSEAMSKEWVATIDRMGSWGDMPGFLKGAVRAAQTTALQWDAILREKLGETVSKKKVSTYKRPSRRFGYPWCGKKSTTRDKKLVLIDTSGSISDKDISRFVAEIDRLSEEQNVDYMTFDDDLHMEEPLEWHPGIEFQFMGRGGTDVQPGLDYAKEHGYQDCVVLTDGYFHVPTEPEGVSVIWVITKGGSRKPAFFGEVIMIDPSEDSVNKMLRPRW